MMRRFYALLPLLVTFLLPTESWAVDWNYEFTVNGIKYSQNGNEREIRMELGGGAYNNVVVPEVEVIGLEDEAYAGELVIPEYVEYDLQDDEMGEAHLKSPVVGMAPRAFQGRGITSVVLANSIEYIGDAAFHQSHIKTLTIPNSVRSIGQQAFHGCYNLTSITIPNSVEEIGYWAFRDCENLIEIHSYINEPYNVKQAFSYSYDDVEDFFNRVTLYVPAGTKALYEATEGWKDFKNIVEIDPSGIATIHSEKNGYGAVYNLSGQRLAAPHRGLNIIGGRKVVMK